MGKRAVWLDWSGGTLGPALRAPKFSVEPEADRLEGLNRSSSSEQLRPHPAWVTVFSSERGEEPGFALSFLYKCPPGDPTVWLGLRTTRKAHCNFKAPILTLKSVGFLEVLCVLILSHSPQVLALPFRGGSAGLAWNLITSLEPAPSSPAGCLFTSGEASGFIYGFWFYLFPRLRAVLLHTENLGCLLPAGPGPPWAKPGWMAELVQPIGWEAGRLLGVIYAMRQGPACAQTSPPRAFPAQGFGGGVVPGKFCFNSEGLALPIYSFAWAPAQEGVSRILF